MGLADALVARGSVLLSNEGAALTGAGYGQLRDFGVDLPEMANDGRTFCRACMDWSERRWHIGGRVGAAIARRCFEIGWVERSGGGRAIRVTRAGETGFLSTFGVDWPGRTSSTR